MATTKPKRTPKLNDKQQRFVDEYCVDCNATQAARRAGYSEDSARQQGCDNLAKPYIRAAINERLNQLALPAAEALKLTADIATTSLNDFIVVRPVQGYALVKRSIGQLIADTEGQIDFVRGYMGREGLRTDEEKAPFLKRIEELRDKLLDYHLQAEQHGPDAVLLVPGPPAIKEVAELDLVALARAQERGRIKSFKHTKDGVQIEMWDAQAALRDILKMHGKYVERKDITTGGEKITGFQLVDFDGSPLPNV